MIDKLYDFSEISSIVDNDDVLSGTIDNEKKLNWNINVNIKNNLKLNIHVINEKEYVVIKNTKTVNNQEYKYNTYIDNKFVVKYNYNLEKNFNIKNNNNKLILKDGNYYYVYIYKYKNNIFFDHKENKLNLISSKSNPVLGATKKYSSMTIEHDINYKYINNFEVVGVLYLYNPFEEKIEKNIYIIDIIYYNTILTKNTKYKLDFLFYNLNYKFDFLENLTITPTQTDE